MKEFIEKLEDFFFDFLGLTLPGFFIILLLTTPLSLLDFKNVDTCLIEESAVLSILINLSKYTDYFFDNPTEIVIGILFLLSYTIGHLVKVLAIIQYQVFEAIFDKFLNKITIDLFGLIVKLFKWIFKRWKDKEFKVWNYINLILLDLYKPLKSTVNKIFTFKSPSYFSDNEVLKDDCIDLINKKFNTSFPKKWYSLYKFSAVINQQENIKSLSSTFLAKYNFYRSMAFIFSLIFIYYLIFFRTTSQILSVSILSLKPLILFGILLLWFTFHYKFKRYWTLCGNETLVSLFYFLKKNYSNA